MHKTHLVSKFRYHHTRNRGRLRHGPIESPTGQPYNDIAPVAQVHYYLPLASIPFLYLYHKYPLFIKGPLPISKFPYQTPSSHQSINQPKPTPPSFISPVIHKPTSPQNPTSTPTYTSQHSTTQHSTAQHVLRRLLHRHPAHGRAPRYRDHAARPANLRLAAALGRAQGRGCLRARHVRLGVCE